ncbi:MarR family winged helix-turn-helix transcriptional regulator [Simiduia aestuariiviva]|uniref:DNA-binding MarR family transcriptional regulator n=1 Tax=Simiduia aestuariiviva TaxID=1510459 RepID=A0A839US05_9GAMM|nr:MarR family transcriptional regulator [Simiduia aestuariiviva]MBB3168177.1 DNA-binding MarR family transcriptional regulator [Simiduia aestuariiviva]
MSEKDFHLHNSFAFWISRLAQQMQERLNHQLKAHGLSWQQWAALNVMHHGLAKTPAQVAEHIGADRSTVTRMLDRLERQALVQREHDGLDRRVVKLHLTDSARQLIKDLNKLAEKTQAEFLSELPSTEYRGLRGSLVKMLRAGGLEAGNLWRQTS